MLASRDISTPFSYQHLLHLFDEVTKSVASWSEMKNL